MKTYTLDLTPFTEAKALQSYLMKELEFPFYYGRNLDALYDCLTELGQDTRLILTDWHHLEYRLGDYSGKAVYVFHCAAQENPHLKICLEP